MPSYVLKIEVTYGAVDQLDYRQGVLLNAPQLPPDPGQILSPVDAVQVLQVLVDAAGLVLDNFVANPALKAC